MLELATVDVHKVFSNKFKRRRRSVCFTDDGRAVTDARLLGAPTEITLHLDSPDQVSRPRAPAEIRRVFAESVVEPQALQQLEAVARLPGVDVAVALPDLHPGNQYPVGCVVATSHLVYAQLVGNDIGCGMALFDCPFRADPDSLYRKFTGWSPPGGPDGMGTIGGGNHFAEVVECRQGAWAGRRFLLVHSGSRSFGAGVNRPPGGVPPDSQAGRAYLAAHDQALAWARDNRRAIAAAVLGAELEPLVDICHNSVTNERGMWLHRKGAAPANRGLVVIPGSRGSPSYVVQKRGSGDHNLDSLAHGAGRCMSRAKTSRRNQKRGGLDLTRTRLGSRVWTTCQQHLEEETPDAYKDIEAVIRDLSEHCSVVAVLTPLLTLKA